MSTQNSELYTSLETGFECLISLAKQAPTAGQMEMFGFVSMIGGIEKRWLNGQKQQLKAILAAHNPELLESFENRFECLISIIRQSQTADQIEKHGFASMVKGIEDWWLNGKKNEFKQALR